MGRRALVLLVALLLAGVAAFAVFRFLSGIEAEVEAGREVRDVYRAAQFIPEGTEGSLALQSGWIEVGQDNTEDLPVGYVATEAELNATLGGRIAVGPIPENGIIVNSQWAQLTVDLKPLRELIPSGKQAMTITTDAVRGVNGFIEPGDRVNVIVTLDIEFNLIPSDAPIFGIPSTGQTTEDGTPTEEEQEVVTLTRYVLQGLPVLAVGRDVRAEAGASTSVDVPDVPVVGQVGQATETAEPVVQTVFTLEVTPEQAERLVYTFENGSVWLTLVPEDFVEVDTVGITIVSLFSGDLVADIFGQ